MIVSTILLGAVFGIVWALLGYALTRGQRDFSSITQVVATRYEVLVEHKVAGQARELLAKLPGALAEPLRVAHGLSRTGRPGRCSGGTCASAFCVAVVAAAVLSRPASWSSPSAGPGRATRMHAQAEDPDVPRRGRAARSRRSRGPRRTGWQPLERPSGTSTSSRDGLAGRGTRC